MGKSINTAIDVAIRAILPDFIEEQVINVKNNLIENGLKEGINKTIDDVVDSVPRHHNADDCKRDACDNASDSSQRGCRCTEQTSNLLNV